MSARLSTVDEQRLAELLDALGGADRNSKVGRELENARGAHASYTKLSEGQVIRWALERVLQAFPEGNLQPVERSLPRLGTFDRFAGDDV